ncbi:MAG: hypothetical protein MJ252_04085 [archaeon]|nr:hypothetical protein [archaeon]
MQAEELSTEDRIRLIIAIINDEGCSELNKQIKKFMDKLNGYKAENEQVIIDYYTQAVQSIPLKSPLYAKLLQLLNDNHLINSVLKNSSSNLESEKDPFIHLITMSFYLECLANKTLDQNLFVDFIQEAKGNINLLYLVLLAIVLVYDGSEEKKFLIGIVKMIKEEMDFNSEGKYYKEISEIIFKEILEGEFSVAKDLYFLKVNYSSEEEEKVKAEIEQEPINVNPFKEIPKYDYYKTMIFPIKDEKISEEYFKTPSYEKLQKILLLSEIFTQLKKDYSVAKKYINNADLFYGFKEGEKGIDFETILPEVFLRLILNSKNEDTDITYLTYLIIFLQNNSNKSNDYEEEEDSKYLMSRLSKYIMDFVSNSGFTSKYTIFQMNNFIDMYSLLSSNSREDEPKYVGINLSEKDKEEGNNLNFNYFQKCFVGKLCSLMSKQNFVLLTDKKYSTILEEISHDPMTPETLSKNYDIITDNIKNKIKFSEIKEKLNNEEGNLLYDFLASILIKRSATLSILRDNLDFYMADILEMVNKDPENEKTVIKCVFDIFGKSSSHLIFLFQTLLKKYVIFHSSLIKFIFEDKLSNGKENISNWIYYELIEKIICNSYLMVEKTEKDLKEMQENISKSDEDKRQEVMKNFETLEERMNKIKEENKNICVDILKGFEDLIGNYKEKGEEDIKLFLIQTLCEFVDILYRRKLITFAIWNEIKEKMNNLSKEN